MRMQVRSLASLSGLRIWCCHELWCRSWRSSDPGLLWLWYRPAAASLIQTSLGTSICHQCSPKKLKKNKKYLEGSENIDWFNHPLLSTESLLAEILHAKGKQSYLMWGSHPKEKNNCQENAKEEKSKQWHLKGRVPKWNHGTKVNSNQNSVLVSFSKTNKYF